MSTLVETPISASEREQLIVENLPQVRLIARRIRERCPENVSLEDLVSAGTIGLISAIDRFDPTQGVKLKTYAEYKIRGAILDSLRSMDWAPREQRRRAKQVESVMSALEQQLQRVPTENEIAAELELSVEDYREWLTDIHGLNVGSLEVASNGDEGRDMLQFLAGDPEDSPAQLLERSELERLVTRAVERMPYNERTVLSLYYHEDLTLREIANLMSLHESRISQLKGQGLLRLRAYLQKSWPTRGTAQSLQTAARA